jgi:hypothetical protein
LDFGKSARNKRRIFGRITKEISSIKLSVCSLRI